MVCSFPEIGRLSSPTPCSSVLFRRASRVSTGLFPSVTRERSAATPLPLHSNVRVLSPSCRTRDISKTLVPGSQSCLQRAAHTHWCGAGWTRRLCAVRYNQRTAELGGRAGRPSWATRAHARTCSERSTARYHSAMLCALRHARSRAVPCGKPRRHFLRSNADNSAHRPLVANGSCSARNGQVFLRRNGRLLPAAEAPPGGSSGTPDATRTFDRGLPEARGLGARLVDARRAHRGW